MHSVLRPEDAPNTRGRLAEVVQAAPGLTLALAVAGVCSALARMGVNAPPAARLADLGLPDGSGIEVIRWLLAHAPASEAMLNSVCGDEAHGVAAIEAGATGCLFADASADEIAQAIVRRVGTRGDATGLAAAAGMRSACGLRAVSMCGRCAAVVRPF